MHDRYPVKLERQSSLRLGAAPSVASRFKNAEKMMMFQRMIRHGAAFSHGAVAAFVALLVTGCASDPGSDVEAVCRQAAVAAVRTNDTLNCQGDHQTVEQNTAGCVSFVEAQVTPIGCWDQYQTYLRCVASSSSCNACQDVRGPFNSCFCASSSNASTPYCRSR